MKLYLTYIFFIALKVGLIQGLDVLRTLLNNGNTFLCNGSNCCTNTEWNLIKTSVLSMTQVQRRGLRGNETALNEMVPFDKESVDDRELQTHARDCARQCAGYVTGYCVAAKCIGYRRRMMDDTTTSTIMDKQDDRHLYWATPCENQKSEMNNLLNNLGFQVSAKCKRLLDRPRLMTCIYNAVC
jgi:hypothetical protein